MPPIPKPPSPAKLRAAKKAAKATAWRKVCRAVDRRDGAFCRACKRQFGVWGLEMREHHHIVPRSLGGKDTTANVLSVCSLCHQDRHAGRLAITGDADGAILFGEMR